jgi:hypothetical protein
MARANGSGDGSSKPPRKRRKQLEEIPTDPDGLLELSERMLEGWEKHKNDPGLQDTEAGREIAALMEEVRENAVNLKSAAEEARKASVRAAAACSALWAQRRGIRKLVERHYNKKPPRRPR